MWVRNSLKNQGLATLRKYLEDQWPTYSFTVKDNLLHLVLLSAGIEAQRFTGVSGFWKHIYCTWYIPLTHLSRLPVSSGSHTHTQKIQFQASVQTALLLWLVHVAVKITLESGAPAEGYSTALQGPGGPCFLQQRTTQAPGMLLSPPRDWAPDYGPIRGQANGGVSSWAGHYQIHSHKFRWHSSDFLLGLTSTRDMGLPFLPAVYPLIIRLQQREYLIRCHGVSHNITQGPLFAKAVRQWALEQPWDLLIWMCTSAPEAARINRAVGCLSEGTSWGSTCTVEVLFSTIQCACSHNGW